MENFLNFVKEYYLLFTIISAILILSLIGFLAEKNISRDVKIKPKKIKKEKNKAVNMTSEENDDNNVESL